jgi:hypothetical protein
MNPYLIEDPIKTKFFFNNKEKECIIVEIKDEEYLACEKTSQGDNYWANSKPGAYGAGLGNTHEDKYKAVRTGLLGQMAFSKVFNQPMDLEYKKGGDKYDNLIGKYKYDIKCAMKNYGKGLIYHTNEWGKKIPLDKDIYVFSYVHSEDRNNKKASIILTGFALKEDVRKCNVEVGFRGNGHLNYVVNFENLKSISKLLELKNHYYGS